MLATITDEVKYLATNFSGHRTVNQKANEFDV